jgi:hypothetical protein
VNLSHSRRRTWEHAAETVLLLGSGVLTAAAVLPKAGMADWLPPLVVMIAGAVICLSVWAASGRGAISLFCLFYGLFLGLWDIWAEAAHVWHTGVVAIWLVGMIIACPWAGHVMMATVPKPEKPGEPKAIEGPSDAETLAEEMAKFEHMFNQIGCAGVQVVDFHEEKSGRVLRLQLPRSGKITLTTLESAAKQIEVILRLKAGAAEFTPGDHSGDIIMRLREREVLVDSPRLRPEVYASTINEPFAIGVQENGDVLKISLRELHMFIVGTTGAGKSNLINVLLAQLSLCPDTLIWVIDMKGGRTAKPWLQAWTEGKAEAPAIDWVATTREEASLMMDAFEQAIETRMNSGIGGSKITPSASMPQIILICDEMAILFGALRGGRAEVGEGATTNQQFIKRAEGSVQKARSEACTSIWATQRGTNTMAASGDLKSLCKLRIALGAATEGDLRYVIPDARIAQKQLAFMADTAGVGMAVVGRNASQLSKFFWHDHITNECSEGGNNGCVPHCPVYRTSIEVGGIRPRIDRMTGEKLGDAYASRWQRAGNLLRRPIPSKTATAVLDDEVDTSQFDALVQSSFGDDPESKVHPAHKRLREILASRGANGATPQRLWEALEGEGFKFARETGQRWLRQDEGLGLIHQATYGRWKIGSKPEEGDGQAA